MRLVRQEIGKLFSLGTTTSMILIAFSAGIVLTVFSGVSVLAEPERAGDIVEVTNLYTDTVYLAWVFPPLVGILFMTGEFRLGTAVHTFLQTPRRGSVVAAKMLASVVGGATVALASLAGAFLTATAIVQIAGDPVMPDMDRVLGALVGLVGTGAVVAPMGVAIGTLVRSQLAALGIFLGWVLLIEQVFVGILGPAGVYLPGALMTRAVSLDLGHATLEQLYGGLTPIIAIVILGVEAVILAVIASYTTLRKDID